MIAAILRIIAADTIDPYASFNASFISAYQNTVLLVKHVRFGSKTECIAAILLKSPAKTKLLSQSQNAKLYA